MQCVSVMTGHIETGKVAWHVPARKTFFFQLHDEGVTFMHPGMAIDAKTAQERLGVVATWQKTVESVIGGPTV